MLFWGKSDAIFELIFIKYSFNALVIVSLLFISFSSTRRNFGNPSFSNFCFNYDFHNSKYFLHCSEKALIICAPPPAEESCKFGFVHHHLLTGPSQICLSFLINILQDLHGQPSHFQVLMQFLKRVREAASRILIIYG